ncbi:helix-turn-helix domain-containing protein [Actinoplanes solisilvae]|uniref:helix-turn-helix domain-containing protein n=1 Tax=Actinoplanes solisilvae TaxID=2486853 RepID=UPI00196B0C43|nr:helix-turn-helix domain-containing protein [Actinoplanes solisilvae]
MALLSTFGEYRAAINRAFVPLTATPLDDRPFPSRSVADLSPACGYSSETQLRRAFRTETGMTPGTYRSNPTARPQQRS